MTNRETGGPAFPSYERIEEFDEDTGKYRDRFELMGGMTLRDYFAANIGFATKEIEDVRGCDDTDLLERFGTEADKEQGFIPVWGRNAPTVAGRDEHGSTLMPLANIELRARLEARARAALRYAEADAMLEARNK